MAVTDLGPNDAWLDEVDAMVRQGITSFKIFMAYPNVLMVNDRTIYKLMERTKQAGRAGVRACGERHGDRRDRAGGAGRGQYGAALPRADAAGGGRGGGGASRGRDQRAGGRGEGLHRACVVRGGDAGSEGGARARAAGEGETCTQYLVLSIEDDMGKPGFEDAKYVFTPPLRKKKNQAPLWQALKDDVLQVVSTDHCPFRFADQKTLGLGNFTKIPNGGPGIENRMQLAYHHGVNAGRMSLERFVEVTAEAPAKIFGMYPEKGGSGRGFGRGYCDLGPGGEVYDYGSDAEYAHRLLHLRRL